MLGYMLKIGLCPSRKEIIFKYCPAEGSCIYQVNLACTNSDVADLMSSVQNLCRLPQITCTFVVVSFYLR